MPIGSSLSQKHRYKLNDSIPTYPDIGTSQLGFEASKFSIIGNLVNPWSERDSDQIRLLVL